MNICTEQIDWTGFFDGGSADDKFAKFHSENPHVLASIIYRARQLKGRGHTRGGIGMIFETLRWDHMMSTESNEPFKLNNNYRAYYSRLVEHEAPDLRGFFGKRRSRADTLEEAL